jgi:HAD superfamily hydrolase (TIGR01458 family)
MSLPGALLLDIDGVLTVSWKALPGAVAGLLALRATGLPMAFVTNTTSTTRSSVAARLKEAGFEVDPEEVFTAPRAAARYLGAHSPGARCLLVNHGEIGEDLGGVTIAEDEDADVVLTGGAGSSITYDLLDRAFDTLVRGAALVAMHRNLDWRTTEGLKLDMGAFIVGLEQAAGVSATVVGKPSRAFFGTVLDWVGVQAKDALMIGDDIEADVLGAQASGICGVLVRTGKFREADLAQPTGRPEHVVDSVADVPALLEALA